METGDLKGYWMRRRGFTLVELLVVIGIIVLLIAILLPSLGRARQSARTAVCATHLRGLAQSLVVYVQEWNVNAGLWGSRDDMNSTYQPFEDANGYWFTWDYQILGRAMSRKDWLLKNGANSEIDKLRYCPEAPSLPPSLEPDFRHPGSNGILGFPGESQREWRRVYAFTGSNSTFHEHSGSYAFNGWLYQNMKWIPPKYNTAGYRWTQVQQKNGSLIPVFVDCIAAELAPDSGDAAPADLNCPFDALTSAFGNRAENRGELSSACIARHRNAVNVAFFDAHVETVKLPDLWTIKWSANWDRGIPQVVPGPGK